MFIFIIMFSSMDTNTVGSLVRASELLMVSDPREGVRTSDGHGPGGYALAWSWS